MRIEIEGMPHGVPAGTYDVEPVQVIQNAGGETVMRMRFKPQPPPEKPKEYLLVEVEQDWARHTMDRLPELAGITDVTVHGKGCCCKNCPWGGNHG